MEEDLKILEEMKYQLQARNKKIEDDIYDNEIFASEHEDNNQKIQAIDNILADRERLEKENLEMKTEIAENVYFGSMPLDQMKQIQSKANKYDSLVEKINEKIDLHKDYLFNQAVTSNPTLDAHFRETERSIISTLQELLKEGEKE